MKYDNIAKYAAKWWADKIGGNTIHDNGDDSFGSMLAGFLADSMIKKPTFDQLEKYRGILANKIVESLKKDGDLWLSCDYRPDVILTEAAKEADIQLDNYPWKTNMKIYNNQIMVSEGYGKPLFVVYSEEESEER